jgi:hypothetical protein
LSWSIRNEGKELNWLPALDGPFYMVLRLYGPEKPYFEKTWIPGDVEKMN